MDKHNLFRIGLFLLALFVIGDALWVLTAPPAGDEPQAFALIVIGIFMLLIGYHIAQRDRP